MSDPLNDILITHATNIIETEDLKYVNLYLRASDIIEYIPCLFYKHNPKEIAMAKKENGITTIMLPNIADYNTEIDPVIKKNLHTELHDGDRIIFNFITGEKLIINGDMQIKQFEVYPNYALTSLSKSKLQQTICIFTYSNKQDVDCLGYIYVSDTKNIGTLCVLSCINRRKFYLEKNEQATTFGLSLACNILQEEYHYEKMAIEERVSKEFKVNFTPSIKNTAILNDLKRFGNRLQQELNSDFMQLLDRADNKLEEETGIVDAKVTSIVPVTVTQPRLLNIPIDKNKILLSNVLKGDMVIASYPRDLLIDIGFPVEVKKILWVGPTNLLVQMSSTDRPIDYELLKVFGKFNVHFEEIKQ
jgi:hypothetical protein